MRSPGRGRYPWRGATAQLFGLVVLPLSILTVVIAFGGLSLHRQAMRVMVGERDERAVRAAASAISEQLNHRTKAVRGLALLAGETLTPEIAVSILEDSDYLLQDFELGMAYYSRPGLMQASTGEAAFWDALDPPEDPLAAALARDAPPDLIVLPHPASGETVVIVLAVAEKGGPVAAGAFDPARLARQTLAGISASDPGGQILLADSSGNVLYLSGSPLGSETLGSHPGVEEALAGNSGTNFAPGPAGEHAVSYSPVHPVGWALVIEESWEEVASPLLRMTEYAPLVLIPAFILALVALWFGVRQIVQPLQALESLAARLGRGNYEAIEEPVGGIAEIQHLQDELINLAGKVKVAQAGLRGYIGAITTGQEEERRRLARELHDDTLQSLIALNQRVQLAALETNDPQAASSLHEVQQLTEQTIVDLRRISRALRPIYLEDLGLTAALKVLAGEIEAASGMAVAFKQHGDPRRLPPATELSLFRMAQEALNNAARHARARQASVEIVFTENDVTLHVKDDGQGFTPPDTPAELAPQGHYGLLGIHEHAELIGSRLRIQSRPGEGTRITITCPQQHDRNRT